jgi:cell wall assembly regulator SMI1
MSDYLDELTNFWRRKNVDVATDKATVSQIAEWERRYSVVLPADLRDYVLRVNGILGGEHLEFDHEGLSFLPLSAMCTEGEWTESESTPGRFVFADFLIRSYWWCAELDDTPKQYTQIVLSAGAHGKTRLIANSLSEFFDIYMNDHSRLHWG